MERRDSETLKDGVRRALPLVVTLGVVLALIAYVYRATFASLVSVWLQTDTFAHCFLIAPITLYLIWQRRRELAVAPKGVSWLGVGGVAALSAAWVVASVANVQFAEQLAAVLLVPAAVVSLLGVTAARQIALPLAYLVLAVPFGEALIPTLMDFTATFTVAALRLTGVPVLREGFFFSIPSGDFEVAKACSGIRYLIACFAIGVLYSYLSYTSWRKRAIFIAISIVAPIIANGIRAYAIVMIAHLSNMTLAVGVDHLIYGWLFFGALIALLFWFGRFFQDEPSAAPPAVLSPARVGSGRRGSFAVAAALVATFAGAGPYWLAGASGASAATVPRIELPALAAAWTGPDRPVERWQRSAHAADAEQSGVYSRDEGGRAGIVEVNVLAYGRHRRSVEVVGMVDTLIDPDVWQVLDRRAVSMQDVPGQVVETVLRSRLGVRVLWHWYMIGETAVAADWRAKLLEARAALFGGPSSMLLVVVSARGAETDEARSRLHEFVRDGGAPLLRCVALAAFDCTPAARECVSYGREAGPCPAQAPSVPLVPPANAASPAEPP